MSCAHHPDAELLAAYAQGAAETAVGLVVATHLALCPSCRREVEALEAVGGEHLAGLEPAALRPGARDAVLARLDESEPEPVAVPSPPASAGSVPVLPEPLRSIAGGDAPSLRWRRPLLGLLGTREVALPLASGGRPARIVELPAGLTIPHHGHRGLEYTLVLSGGLRDEFGVFHRGDLSHCGPDVVHEQTVLPDAPCLCLVVNSDRLVPLTTLGRVMARITGE